MLLSMLSKTKFQNNSNYANSSFQFSKDDYQKVLKNHCIMTGMAKGWINEPHFPKKLSEKTMITLRQQQYEVIVSASSPGAASTSNFLLKNCLAVYEGEAKEIAQLRVSAKYVKHNSAHTINHFLCAHINCLQPQGAAFHLCIREITCS